MAEPHGVAGDLGAQHAGIDDTTPTTLGDCYELVMRLALDGGLAPPEAVDVCIVTMLQLLDEGGAAPLLGPAAAEWLLRTAVEQCAVARRLSVWRRPQLFQVPADASVVRA